jgi:hypothetical protein
MEGIYMTNDAEPSYFSGEDELSALLLAMVIDHCGAYSPERRRSMAGFYGDHPPSDAMVALYEMGLIEITEPQDGPRIVAKVTAEGRTILDRLRREQQRNAAANWQRYDGTLPPP